MKPYAKYKSTGLNWLPEVPAHWEVLRGKNLFTVINERSEKGLEKLLSVSEHHGVIERAKADVTMFMAESYEGYKLCWPDDFVVNSLWAWSYGMGFSHDHGIISTAYSVYRLKDKKRYCPNYYNYLLRGTDFHWEMRVRSKGLWKSRYQLSDGDFMSSPMIVPPPDEQAKIVAYLDAKTAKIDRLIKLKEREIELLQEKKQAVISQVVMRGLDPNVELVDSGIPGLAKIPSHWRRRPLKAVLETPMCDGPHTTPEFVSDGIPFVSAEAAHDGRIFVEDCRGLISRELHCEYCRRLRPQRGDIFIVKSGSTTGKTVMVDTDAEFSVWSPLALVRTGKKMNNRFLFNYLTSIYFQRQVQDNWSYGTQPNIGMGVLRNLYVIEPPKKEQDEIVSYLDEETSRIGGLISMFTRQIALLKEYRTRLISDAVTGRIDLRNLA